MNEILIPNTRAYADRHQLELAEPLGSGKDGIVLAAQHKAKPADIAVKVHRSQEPYQREAMVYRRLAASRITTVQGFNVPQLLGHDDHLRAIEMTIVRRPFVLDFAGAYLDVRPEFPEDVWEAWAAEKREQFEARWRCVQRILDTFEGLGVYLMDVSPANTAFID